MYYWGGHGPAESHLAGSVWCRMGWHALTGLLALATGLLLLPLASRANPETRGIPANPCVRPVLSTDVPVTKERAVIAAVNAATTRPPAAGVAEDLVLVGIEDVRVQRMSRSAALRRIGPYVKPLSGSEPEAESMRGVQGDPPVWLLSMEGPTFATTHSSMGGDRMDRARHAIVVDAETGEATAISSEPERNARHYLQHTQRYRAPEACTRYRERSAPDSIFVYRGPARIGDTSRGYFVGRESNAFPLFRSAADAVLARLEPPRGATATSRAEEARIADAGAGLGLRYRRRDPGSGEHAFAWTTIPADGGVVYATAYDGRRSIRTIPERAALEMDALRALLDPPRLGDRIDMPGDRR